MQQSPPTKHTEPPRVCVLMPCRNAELYIREAIESILAQTYQHFEFLIIDNVSADATPDIVREYAANDSRITYIRNPRDLGIAGSLNKGLRLATGEYVARMDADDVAMPDRLEKQIAYMEANADCVICGSNIILIDENGKQFGKRDFPQNDGLIKQRMLAEIPFCHPATLLRRRPIIEHEVFYDETIFTVEDRDFWLRFAEYGRYANLPEPLLRYRISDIGMKQAEHRRTLVQIIKLQLRYAADPRFRGLGIVWMMISESVLLCLPGRMVTALYRFKYRK